MLTLPHSNADEEHVFSLIRQNKTDFWNSLALDGTLSSILSVKMSCQEPCYKFEPTADVIKKSKKQRRNITKYTPVRTNNNQTNRLFFLDEYSQKFVNVHIHIYYI